MKPFQIKKPLNNMPAPSLIGSTKWLLLAAATLLVFACAVGKQNPSKENQKALTLFEDIFEENLLASPVDMAYLGRNIDQDKWDDYTEKAYKNSYNRSKRQRNKLNNLDATQLTEENKLSLSLYQRRLKNSIQDYKWRYHHYAVNQMFGIHQMGPSILINQQKIKSYQDAQNYLSRLQQWPKALEQTQAFLLRQQEQGIVAPSFVYPYVYNTIEILTSGFPIDTSESPNALFKDFSFKLKDAYLRKQVTAEQRKELLNAFSQALQGGYVDGYQALQGTLKTLEKAAPSDIGVWQWPDGDAYYAERLRSSTTSNLTADQIHQIGLQQVDAIHAQMREILTQINYSGSLNDFFTHIRESGEFILPDNDFGRREYLNRTIDAMTQMQVALPKLFHTIPQSKITVKAVEPFREKSTGKAFYHGATEDGRPAIYYVNLSKMKNMPTYQLEALAYHEGVPGHHMQVSIARELKDLPTFRKYDKHTAYVEGWGLYAESLPKEIGLYQDPYSDFGRLSMALWRACRLVVDTGIHSKRWSKQEAIDFYVENTPNAENDALRMVERHAVMPAQATSYMIGSLEILRLREKAKISLGDAFDIRDFHEVVLSQGSLPLEELETVVDNWLVNRLKSL